MLKILNNNNKYKLYIEFPILLIITENRIPKREFQQLKKYCEYIGSIYPKIKTIIAYGKINYTTERVLIFRFKGIEEYQKFCKKYLGKEVSIEINRIGTTEMKPIEEIILQNTTVRAKLKDSTFEYIVPLNVIYKMLEVLYQRKEIRLKEFDKILHECKILNDDQKLYDKSQGTLYKNYWIGPYRILMQYALETGKIFITKPNKNDSLIVFSNPNEIPLDELKKDIYEWIIRKIRIKKEEN